MCVYCKQYKTAEHWTPKNNSRCKECITTHDRDRKAVKREYKRAQKAADKVNNKEVVNIKKLTNEEIEEFLK